MLGLEDFWWFEHLADMFSLAMAGGLILLGVVLWTWPPPKSRLRYATAVSAWVAAFVVFWSATVRNLAPHPRMAVGLFIVLFTITMIKHRATVVAKQMSGERRINGA